MNSLIDYIVECAQATERTPWEVEPKVQRGLVQNTGYFLPRKVLAQVFEFPDMFGHNAILSYKGGEFPASMLTSETALRSFMDENGASLVIPGLQKLSEPLRMVCERACNQTGLEMFATGFGTPAGKEGLEVHWDMGTVVVAQLDGVKHWRLWPPVVRTLEELRQPRHITPEEKTAQPFLELQLQPGDVLFLPRGWLHTAACREVSSFHVSIGVVHGDMRRLKLRSMS
ncbi:MAG TPA: cupin domain-containing protein [Candidatus Saccharimonadales bacterium]|nr:cupin domain-containing protein [Candidatus Saccharimonadales bacterium]